MRWGGHSVEEQSPKPSSEASHSTTKKTKNLEESTPV